MELIIHVCPRVDITFTVNSQLQRHHKHSISPLHHENKLVVSGLVQASTNTNVLQTNHVNSGRVYKLYIINTQLDILSYTQDLAYHLTASFQYNNHTVLTQVTGCEDCKYNGWVRLDCTEYKQSTYPHGSVLV